MLAVCFGSSQAGLVSGIEIMASVTSHPALVHLLGVRDPVQGVHRRSDRCLALQYLLLLYLPVVFLFFSSGFRHYTPSIVFHTVLV